MRAIRTTARREGDELVVNGQKMWVTNGARAGLMAAAREDRSDGRSAAGRHDRADRREEAGRRASRAASRSRRRGCRSSATRASSRPRSCSTTTACRPRRSRRARGRGPGLLPDDERHRDRPHQRRRPRARRRAARLRARHPLRPGALRVRQADRPAPADPGEARRHGDRHRGRQAPDRRRRAQEGRGRPRRRGGRHGEAVRDRGRAALRRGVDAHPRRLRLLEGVRDRAPLPRQPAAADRRGHQRDPAADHRARPAPPPRI